jgi:hypothetical protein
LFVSRQIGTLLPHGSRRKPKLCHDVRCNPLQQAVKCMVLGNASPLIIFGIECGLKQPL